MNLDFFAEFAIFLEGKFAFAFDVHINLIPVCGVILVFTDGTD